MTRGAWTVSASAIAFLLAVAWTLPPRGQERELPRGLFSGLGTPGKTAELFAPEFFTREVHSPPTFTPDGREVFWVEMAGTHPRILHMRLYGDAWTPPRPIRDTGPGDADDPHPNPAGDRLFFTSNRGRGPFGLLGRRRAVWFLESRPDGWGNPTRTSIPGKGLTMHWGFSVAGDGDLYFSGSGEASPGPRDLYRVSADPSPASGPTPLPAPVNSPSAEDTPWIAPDGSFLLFARRPGEVGGSDIYLSYRRNAEEWEDPFLLSAGVNSSADDVYPVLSPDGTSLLFISNRSGRFRPYRVGFHAALEPGESPFD